MKPLPGPQPAAASGAGAAQAETGRRLFTHHAGYHRQPETAENCGGGYPAADPHPDDPNVSLSIINTNFSARAGLSAARDGLFMEGPDSPYVNAIVAREDNKDSKKIQELKAAFQTSEVAEKRRKSTKATRSKAGKPEPAPSLQTASRYSRHRERSSNQIKTGAPSVAVTTPIGSSAAESASRAIISAPARRLPLPACRPGARPGDRSSRIAAECAELPSR